MDLDAAALPGRAAVDGADRPPAQSGVTRHGGHAVHPLDQGAVGVVGEARMSAVHGTTGLDGTTVDGSGEGIGAWIGWPGARPRRGGHYRSALRRSGMMLILPTGELSTNRRTNVDRSRPRAPAARPGYVEMERKLHHGGWGW